MWKLTQHCHRVLFSNIDNTNNKKIKKSVEHKTVVEVKEIYFWSDTDYRWFKRKFTKPQGLEKYSHAHVNKKITYSKICLFSKHHCAVCMTLRYVNN